MPQIPPNELYELCDMGKRPASKAPIYLLLAFAAVIALHALRPGLGIIAAFTIGTLLALRSWIHAARARPCPALTRSRLPPADGDNLAHRLTREPDDR